MYEKGNTLHLSQFFKIIANFNNKHITKLHIDYIIKNLVHTVIL